MEYKKIGDNIIMRIDRGEEVLKNITMVCEVENITLGSISALGACDYVKMGLYDIGNKEYISKELTGPMEITSLIGNISTKDDKTYLHLHINVCDDKMQVFGGHLNECVISATCEIIITKIDGKVNRKFDEAIGLNLFDFEKIGTV